jgi:MFS family permease
MKRKRYIVYLAGFLFSLPVALTSYINSSLLESFTNPTKISLIYIVASMLVIFGLLQMPKVLAKIGNYKTTLLLSILGFISLLLLAFSKNSTTVIISFIVYFISVNFITTTLDIFIEDFTLGPKVGRARGIYLTIINSAWIIAQMISGSIITKSSFKGIYLISALFMFLVGIILVFFFQKFQDPEYKKIAAIKTLKFFIRNKNISKIYLINLILKFFFAWMIIYTPIYLHNYIGFDWQSIGIIFTIMLLPFILLDFPLGKLSDKIGEKKMLFIAFLISAISTIAIPFILEANLYLWAFILFMTRVGAATIEVMSDSYFFRIVDEKHADEITFFRNTTAISYIIAPLAAIAILTLTPSFKFIFFILGAVLLVGAYLALRLRTKYT